MIAIERLQQVLSYEPSTGVLRWRVSLGTRSRAGSVAGSANKGYIEVGIDGVRGVKAHRIAWALTHGEWPRLPIDHIDGNASNNAIQNLRLATHGQNHQNLRSARSDNALGMLGVSRHKGRYRAQIQVNGKKRWIGEFASAEQAQLAYLEAKRQHHPFGTL